MLFDKSNNNKLLYTLNIYTLTNQLFLNKATQIGMDCVAIHYGFCPYKNNNRTSLNNQIRLQKSFWARNILSQTSARQIASGLIFEQLQNF